MMPNILSEIIKSRKKSLIDQIHLISAVNPDESNHKRKKISDAINIHEGISIISEIKPASPSQGDIRRDIDIREVASIMEKSGVIGLSVLTEPVYFNGSFQNLYLALKSTLLPCLMKDFVFSREQFKIARDFGATNILLINLLGNLEEMYDLALEFDLEPIIEIHDVAEIEDLKHLNEIGIIPSLIGVNNRNLKTLEIDLDTSKELIPEIKKIFNNEVKVISESGINTLDDIKYLESFEADAFLIGSSIMQSNDIEQKILQLRGIN